MPVQRRRAALRKKWTRTVVVVLDATTVRVAWRIAGTADFDTAHFILTFPDPLDNAARGACQPRGSPDTSTMMCSCAFRGPARLDVRSVDTAMAFTGSARDAGNGRAGPHQATGTWTPVRALYPVLTISPAVTAHRDSPLPRTHRPARAVVGAAHRAAFPAAMHEVRCQHGVEPPGAPDWPDRFCAAWARDVEAGSAPPRWACRTVVVRPRAFLTAVLALIGSGVLVPRLWPVTPGAPGSGRPGPAAPGPFPVGVAYRPLRLLPASGGWSVCRCGTQPAPPVIGGPVTHGYSGTRPVGTGSRACWTNFAPSRARAVVRADGPGRP